MTQELALPARKAIHEQATAFLSEEGMRVEHVAAREELAAAGAEVEGAMVRVSPALIDDAIDQAPESFDWRARDPEKSVRVGTGDPVIAPTRGPRYVKRPGEPRHRATMADFDQLVKLAHQESAIDVVGYDLCSPKGYSLPGNPGGFDQAATGHELLARLFSGTDKPIVGSARSGDEAAASLEMARTAFDEPHLEAPTVMGILHVRSPLVLNKPMVDGLLQFARAGQPLAVSSGAIPGASAPHSLAEAAVQVTAEALFGAVFVQVINPGTPVIFGRSATIYDRAAGAVSAGIPGSSLQDVIVEMADFYDLPSRGSGGATDAKAIDEQSGAESMHHLSAAIDSGADLLLNATGGLDTYASVSPEKTVLDSERIRTLQQAETEATALATNLKLEPSLDQLREAEPGAAFFDERDPEMLPDAPVFENTTDIRGSHETWHTAGNVTVTELATSRVEFLLAEYEQPPIDTAVAQALFEHIEEYSAD
ncbi:trimethylamine methyltransferase family protein [Halodesulfurarchaeum sp.]|uniref:trimethylamine methyltransferase family protein n=1 Tax=Halodesulfurarchaeum sp. TaxID=1980530 RepID=UPI002FC3603F